MTEEMRKILRGEYGRTVLGFDPELQKKAIGSNQLITGKPSDLLEPEMNKLEKEMSVYRQQDEDVLSYAMFPDVARDFFKYREAIQNQIDPGIYDNEHRAYPV